MIDETLFDAEEKMEHTVSAPGDGTVTEVRVQPGQQVEAGTVLVVVEETTDAD